MNHSPSAPKSLAERLPSLLSLLWLLVYAGVIGVVVLLLLKGKYQLAVFPAIGILGLFFFWRYTSVAFYAILAMVPFDAYRSLLGGSFTISKLLGVLIVGIVGATVIIKKHEQFTLRSNLWGPIAGLLLVAIFSALNSPWPDVAWDNVRKLMIAIVMFAITLYFVKEKDIFRYLPAVIIIGTSISALLAVYGYVSGDAAFAMDVAPDSSSIARGTGAANDPNIFAMTLLFAYPLLAHLTLNGKTPMVRLISACLLANNLAAIILTFSRGAALVFVICSIIFFSEHARRFRPQYLGFVLTAMAGVFFALVIFVPASYWERQASLTDTQDSSLNRRKTYISVGKEALAQRPIFGFGPGCFKEFYGGTETAARFARRSQTDYRRYAHNTFLEVVVGMGASGLAFFLLTMFVSWRDFGLARKIFLAKGEVYYAEWCLAYRTAMVGLSLNFLFLSNLYNKYFWVALGLAQVSIIMANKFVSDKQQQVVGGVTA